MASSEIGLFGAAERLWRRITRGALSVASAAVFATACAADMPPPALVVGDVAYTDSELGALSLEQREQLAELTAFGLIVVGGGLGELAEPFVERERAGLLLQRLAMEVSIREAGYDDAALRAAYDLAPEYELTVRHLVILAERWRSEDETAAARRRAEEALARIRNGEDFGVVAGEVSEEPGAAERRGLLQPGRRGTWVDEFWEAASALEVGQVSDVVRTQYGFHVLRLDDRRIVPFEEVRGQVLERLVDPRVTTGRAEAWAERETAVLEVREKEILAWRRDGGPDDVVLAAWPGGTYTGADLGRYLLTLDREHSRRVVAADDAAYLALVQSAARNALLVARADALGITLPATEVESITEAWRAKFQGWATTLGFRPGSSPEAVKAAAFEAFSSPRQSVQITRAEVLKHAPALRAHYAPVHAGASD